MTDPAEDGNSSEPSKKDTWEVLESISKIIAALGIPVVLAVGGWIIQGTVSQQTVSKDYVLLATDILKTKREAGEDGGLRKWAVDLLNRTSPVPLDEATAQQLIKGTITIPLRNPETVSTSDFDKLEKARKDLIKARPQIEEFLKYLRAINDDSSLSLEVKTGIFAAALNEAGIAGISPSPDEMNNFFQSAASDSDRAALIRALKKRVPPAASPTASPT